MCKDLPWIKRPNLGTILKKVGEEVLGVFYDSRSKVQHLAAYEPYLVLPTRTLCGKAGSVTPGGFTEVNFSPSAEVDNICPKCLKGVALWMTLPTESDESHSD